MSRFSTRDITLTALFAALAVVAAVLIRYGGAIVPFSLLPFVAMLAGGLLGPRLGALSMLVYILLGLAGLPVFAKPPFGGPAYVLQPTFGFLIGFAAAAYVIGILLKERGEAGAVRYLAAMLAGVAVMYLVGLPYLYVILTFFLGNQVPVSKLMAIGFTPFIIPDVVKAVIAAAMARALYRRLNMTAEGSRV